MGTEPITREEMPLNAVATGEAANLEPITREEMFLAKLGGSNVTTPEPITRKEQFLQKAIDAGGSSAATDPTLTIEGAAADAKAVGDALAEKAPKELLVAIKVYDGGEDRPHCDYSADEIIAHIQNGGSVIASYSDHPSGQISYYCTLENYTINPATVTFSKLYIYSTSVYRYNTKVNSDKSVTTSSETYIAKIENCSGEVGNIARVASVNYMGKPNGWELVPMPKSAAVADAAGDTPTAEEFNALLAALRNAGLMATE